MVSRPDVSSDTSGYQLKSSHSGEVTTIETRKGNESRRGREDDLGYFMDDLPRSISVHSSTLHILTLRILGA